LKEVLKCEPWLVGYRWRPVLLLTGCVEFGDFGDSEAYKEDFHHTYPLSPGGSVSVETFNGFH
jgi:hypothetical protein